MATTLLQSRGINIVSGGTDDHLFLVDLIGKEYSGKDAEEALGQRQHHREQELCSQ